MNMLGEFKAFAMRGNVIDLAVGVVIGAAFGKIVTALVNGLLMPVLGILVSGVNFADLALELKPAVLGPNNEVVQPAVLLQYGAFLQSVIDFTIVAFAIFLLVKGINRLHRKQEEAPAAAPEPSEEVKLLREIRDQLKKVHG